MHISSVHACEVSAKLLDTLYVKNEFIKVEFAANDCTQDIFVKAVSKDVAGKFFSKNKVHSIEINALHSTNIPVEPEMYLVITQLINTPVNLAFEYKQTGEEKYTTSEGIKLMVADHAVRLAELTEEVSSEIKGSASSMLGSPERGVSSESASNQKLLNVTRILLIIAGVLSGIGFLVLKYTNAAI